ncbi:MAG: VTT domain-containing protein [Gammaproteobacteria bacterium]
MNRGVIRSAIAILLLLAILLVTLVYRDTLDVQSLQTRLIDAGAAAPLLFILLFAAATVMFLPGSLLTLAGGALFGPVWGTLYNLTGATLGATAAFLIARYLAGDWVEQRASGRLQRLKRGIEHEGWRFVAFVRLVPLFPFNALNYALGLTRIRLPVYMLASFIFMFPAALAYTYIGYAGREAIAGGEGAIRKALLALALLAIVGLLPGMIGRLRQGGMITVAELKQRLQQENGKPLLLDVRTRREYLGKDGHIAGSLNVPLHELKARLDELRVQADRPIAVVCHTDKRSAKAARLLARQGFTNVEVVRGGITAWRAAGESVHRDSGMQGDNHA